MKTTLELPDHLLAEAKAMALKNRITLKTLFTRALERELRVRETEVPHRRFVVDESGWPVWHRELGGDQAVKETFINELREAEGV
ncbi:MAG: hypothetical protein ACKV19_27855 [Verrucomicrobiales bacterium]